VGVGHRQFGQPGTGPQRVLQKKLVYYSDFDMDTNDWKAERQTLDIYAKTLANNLSTSRSSPP
jgi:hypothetical protein